MKAQNWFQLRIVGVTKNARDSDSGRSPLVRCGKYVSRACTLDFAPVQVRDTFGVLLNRASLEVPFGKHQGRLAKRASSPSMLRRSGPFSTLSTVSKRRDAHEALELDSMVLRADNGAAQSVAKGMEVTSHAPARRQDQLPVRFCQ